MAILSNIGAALFFIAFILLVLCIISFFKKNGKAKQYGRPTVILFMISILLTGMGTTKSEHPVIDFFATLSFILFIFFLVLAILSVIKKDRCSKKNNLLSLLFYLSFLVRYQAFQTLLLKKQQQLVKKLLLTMQKKKESEKKKRTRKRKKRTKKTQKTRR